MIERTIGTNVGPGVKPVDNYVNVGEGSDAPNPRIPQGFHK
jgi:hypothetical protein